MMEVKRDYGSFPNPPGFLDSRESESPRTVNSYPPQQHANFHFDNYQIDPKTISYDPEKVDPISILPEYKNPISSTIHDAPSDKFTKRQLIVLIVYSFTEFFSGAVVSLQAPFFPAEAEKKGLTATEYGAVFGIFEFVVFLISFVYGKYTSAVGPKFLFNLGMFTVGVCSILFGMLDQVEGRLTFFALSMLLRIVEAMATAAVINSAFVIIAIEFPKSVATTFATMETVFGVGLACGPVIGGALFQLGGFPVPFVATGALLILTAIFTFFLLPTPVDPESEKNEGKKGILDLLRIPEVAVATFCIFTSALSIGHISATIEPHIRMFELSSVSVGFVIVISGITYAICAPLWGLLCDRKPTLQLYMVLGSISTIIGYLLIGPAPFLPFDTILWVTCVGMVFHGIGVGGCLVASFIQALYSATAHGFPEGVASYSLISGIWSSFFSLGNFVGPTVSGILYDTVGFRNGTLFVVALHSLVVLSMVVMMCLTRSRRKGSQVDSTDENGTLLGKNNRK